ncbi:MULTISPECIES: aspartyl protease family protein [unclassified Sphingomonas]|jgi:Aspartyl protease|nr:MULTISPECIES: aspartyl protease family protein [unclassified Sphingomonas]
MRTHSVKWRHNHQRLLLPVAIFPGLNSNNPFESLRYEGLIDTGATGTGIRADVAAQLALRQKGQRRVATANGLIYAAEYIIRIGFMPGDLTDPATSADAQHPYVLEGQLIAFELHAGFSYPVLIGMDVIAAGDLTVSRDGRAEFVLP